MDRPGPSHWIRGTPANPCRAFATASRTHNDRKMFKETFAAPLKRLVKQAQLKPVIEPPSLTLMRERLAKLD